MTERPGTLMNRQSILVTLVILALIVLSAVLFVLQTQTQDDLDHANKMSIQRAADAATQSAQDHATATEAHVVAAAAQTALSADLTTQQAAFDSQSTQQSQVIRTATRSVADAATQSAHDSATATKAHVMAEATQDTLSDDLATQQAAFDSQSTQQSQVIRTATRSAAHAATQSAQDHATATEVHVVAAATQDALSDDLATQDAAFTDQKEQFGDVMSTATQGAVAFETANARYDEQQATLQAQAAYIATLDAPLSSSDEPVAEIEVGNLLSREDFDGDPPWAVGPVTGSGRVDLRNGQYWLTVMETPSLVEVWSVPFISDAYMEAEVYFDDCPPDGFFAISARLTEENDDVFGYYYAVSCDLTIWSLSSYTDQGFDTLVFNTFVPISENPARRHVLGFWLQGSTLKAYFDGVELGTATDNTFSAGLVGFYAESDEENVVVKVESLRVWSLP
jgi:hypothetical protein